jgi:hypothetical protein
MTFRNLEFNPAEALVCSTCKSEAVRRITHNGENAGT